MRSAARAKVHVQKKVADVENMNDAQLRRARRDLDSRPALRRAYEKISVVVQNLSIHDARCKHAIGVVVLAAREDPKKYGKGSVQTLAILLGYDKSTLHDFADVAETWKAAEFAALLRRKNGLGLPLKFSHLVVVHTVDDKKKRDQFLERALKENLTVKQLELVVRGREIELDDIQVDGEPAEARDVRRTAAAWSGEIDQLKRKTAWVIQRAKSNPGPLVLEGLKGCAEQQHAISSQAGANAKALEAAIADLGRAKTKRG